MPKRNILLALYDIRPKDAQGKVRVSDFQLEPEINLRKRAEPRSTLLTQAPVVAPEPAPQAAPVAEPIATAELPEPEPIVTRFEESLPTNHSMIPPDLPAYEGTSYHGSIVARLLGEEHTASEKDIIAKEIEASLDAEQNLVADLVRVGATIHQPVKQRVARAKLFIPNPPKPKEEPIEQVQPEAVPEVAPMIPDAPELLVQEIVAPPPPQPPQPVATVVPHISHLIKEHDTTELENFWRQVPTAHPKPARTIARTVSVPVQQQMSPAARNVEILLEKIKEEHRPSPKKINTTKRVGLLKRFLGKRTVAVTAVGCLALLGFAVASVGTRGYAAKEEVLQNGAEAIQNLEAAKASLEQFHFSEAADHFALAHSDFQEASQTMSHYGASILSLFSNIPGISKVTSAQRLINAGEQLSKAGEELSRAFNTLHQTNFFAMMPHEGQTKNTSLLEPMKEFQDALEFTHTSIQKATKQLEKVDTDAIPEDKRDVFEEFKEKIPLFEAYVDQALVYSEFLLNFIGERAPKTYMVLFQNNSERRATGGFPGSYAIVSFEKGALKRVFVDDIYNIDGQIRENRIPPVPLQHITPNLGTRDVNWFADFPTTAQKIQEYYQLDGGAPLDGVFTITPTVIGRILGITGPIDLPAYGVTLDQHNFLAEIQNEVEYKGDRKQPKKILVDFQPKFFETLAAQDKERWMEIFKILITALQEKHIMAYFNNPALQKEVLRDGFGGELKNPDDSDYLQVAFLNVRGSKTDAVTKNSMNLTIELGEESIGHRLNILRAHQGGDSKYNFYNTENPAYVKVYVPHGATFESIEGATVPNYKPLVAYADLGFKPDSLISQVEGTITRPAPGVDVFEESGKRVFGFWMITKPRKTSNVILSYSVPRSDIGTNKNEYALYWQKQSGTEHDQIHVNTKLSNNVTVTSSSPNIQFIGNTMVYDADLSIDRLLQFKTAKK